MRLFAQKPVAVLALFLRILPERTKTLSEPAVQNTCTSPSGLQTRMSSSTPPGLQRRPVAVAAVSLVIAVPVATRNRGSCRAGVRNPQNPLGHGQWDLPISCSTEKPATIEATCTLSIFLMLPAFGKCLGAWPAFSFRVETSQGASKDAKKHPSRFKQASNGVKTFPPSPMFGSGFKTNSAVPNYKASVDEIVCTLQLRWASWMMMASS